MSSVRSNTKWIKLKEGDYQFVRKFGSTLLKKVNFGTDAGPYGFFDLTLPNNNSTVIDYMFVHVRRELKDRHVWQLEISNEMHSIPFRDENIGQKTLDWLRRNKQLVMNHPLYSEKRSMMYNICSFAMRNSTHIEDVFVQKELAEHVQKLPPMYKFYLDTEMLNDMLFYMPKWTPFVFLLLSRDVELLWNMANAFHKKTLAFCFDDTLEPLLIDLGVRARFKRRMSSSEVKSCDRETTRLLVSTKGVQDCDCAPDESPLEAFERELVEEQLVEISVMKAEHVDLIVQSPEACRRFHQFADPASARVYNLAVAIYSHLVKQLIKVKNNYCDEPIMEKIARKERNMLHWNDLGIRKQAVDLLVTEYRQVVHFTMPHSQWCLVIRHVEVMETFLLNLYRSLIETNITPPSQFLEMLEENGRKNNLDEKQMSFLRAAAHHRFSMLTGRPGTGKTCSIATLIMTLQKYGKTNWAIATPTCRSQDAIMRYLNALNIFPHDTQVRTMQYFIAYTTSQRINGKRKKSTDSASGTQSTKILNRPHPTVAPQIWFLDECSMISTELAYWFFKSVQVEHLVVIGDLDQCLPITPGRPFFVFADIERSSPRLVELTHVYRNDGAILQVTRAILENDSAAINKTLTHVDTSDPLWGESVRSASGRVYAFDVKSNVPRLGQFVNTLLDKIPSSGPCPVQFLTYNINECNTINYAIQRRFADSAIMEHKLLLGPASSKHKDDMRGATPYFAARQSVAKIAKSIELDRFKFNCINMGDYVYLRKNMFELHACIDNDGFLFQWEARYLEFLPQGDERANWKCVSPPADHVSNGDTGLIVQMYVLDMIECPHMNGTSKANKRTKKDDSAAKSNCVTLCSTCPSETGCIMAGKTWAMRHIVGSVEIANLKSMKLSESRMLVAVILLDRTQKLVHVPAPYYKFQNIGLGWAITTFKSQGCQYDNVCFVVSNARRPQGAQGRGYWQRKQERLRGKYMVGTRSIDSYFFNSRLFYVAVSRTKHNTFVYFPCMPYQEKVRQMLEHDDLPPCYMEELAENRAVGLSTSSSTNSSVSPSSTTSSSTTSSSSSSSWSVMEVE